MAKLKLYLSLFILLFSSVLGTSIILDDSNIDNKVYASELLAVNDVVTTSTESTTTSTTSTTTSSNTTTTKKVERTTSINLNNTLSISNSNKVYYLKQDDGTGKILNENKYGMLDSRLNFMNIKMVIYGHSNPDGSGLFQYLQNYDGNKSFYDNHKYITINYDNKEYKYIIFSVFIQTLDSSKESTDYYMKYWYDGIDEYKKEVQKYKNKSQYDTGVDINDEKILILQTCSMNKNYINKRANLLIIAKRI